MGRMKNGANFMKNILVFFNPVVMIYSLVLTGLGVVYSLKWSTVIELLPMGKELIDSMPSWTPSIMFYGGLIMFLISILGCCGAFCESYWAYVMYAILLFGVTILQVTLGVLVYFSLLIGQDLPMPMQLSLLVSRAWPDVSISAQNAPEEVYSAFYDNLQTSEFGNVLEAQEVYKCCGLYDKSDYSVYGKSLSVLAKSCCPAEVEKCTPDEAYDDGCLYEAVWSEEATLLKNWLELSRIIQGVAIIYVCLQVMLVASALYVAKATLGRNVGNVL